MRRNISPVFEILYTSKSEKKELPKVLGTLVGGQKGVSRYLHPHFYPGVRVVERSWYTWPVFKDPYQNHLRVVTCLRSRDPFRCSNKWPGTRLTPTLQIILGDWNPEPYSFRSIFRTGSISHWHTQNLWKRRKERKYSIFVSWMSQEHSLNFVERLVT